MSRLNPVIQAFFQSPLCGWLRRRLSRRGRRPAGAGRVRFAPTLEVLERLEMANVFADPLGAATLASLLGPGPLSAGNGVAAAPGDGAEAQAQWVAPPAAPADPVPLSTQVLDAGASAPAGDPASAPSAADRLFVSFDGSADPFADLLGGNDLTPAQPRPTAVPLEGPADGLGSGAAAAGAAAGGAAAASPDGVGVRSAPPPAPAAPAADPNQLWRMANSLLPAPPAAGPGAPAAAAQPVPGAGAGGSSADPPLPWGLGGGSSFTVEARNTYPATGPTSAEVDQHFADTLGYVWDDNAGWQAGDYRVTVDYGDGSAPAQVPLTLVTTSDGVRGNIQADHTYANATRYRVAVTAQQLASGATQALTDDVAVNARPFPYKQSVSTNQDTPLDVALRATDPDGTTQLTYSIFQQPANGSVSLAGNVATYTPAAGFSGEDEFLFQAHDDTAASNLGVVRVHVEPAPADNADTYVPPHDPPTAAIADALLKVHAGESVTLPGTATDPLGLADLTVQWDLNYDGGTFRPDHSADGSLTPTHTYPDAGVYLVALQVTDSAGQTASDVASVEVLDPSEPVTGNAPPAGAPGGGSGDGPASPPPGPGGPPFSPAVQASSGHIHVGDSVFFTASGGSWAKWDFNNADAQHFNSTAYGLTVAHTFAGPGVYAVAATVSDDSGDEQVVSATVTVDDVPTLVVVPPPDQAVQEGDAVTFATPGSLDLVGQVDLASIQWDFDYRGTFQADPTAAGDRSPTHLFAPGEHVAAVQLADDRGHSNVGVVDVYVSRLAPDVSAGADQTVDAGTPLTFAGTASSPVGIAAVEWDFNYDGQTFHADASGRNPTHVFADPGTYDVALRAVDRRGEETVDVIAVTVNDVAPTGGVVLAPSKPDGSPQDLKATYPVYFAVSGLAYSDPSATPSLWVSWGDAAGLGDPGDFEVVPQDQWLNVVAAADGSLSFLVAHTYDDTRAYDPVFHFADAEGNLSSGDVPVTIADVPPVGTFGWGDGVHTIAPTDTVSFTDVHEPSQAETDAGFTYYYQVDGHGFAPSDSPEITLEDQPAGTTHTVQAYIQDHAGSRSPVYTQVVRVRGDVAFVDGGTGAARLDWTDTQDQTGSATLAAGETYAFTDEPADLRVTLLSAGASYDLSTNGSIGAIDASGAAGVTLEVHTDEEEGLPDSVGDGHVGPVTLGASSSLTVASRGDFGGVQAVGAGSVAVSLTFENLTGPIRGLEHIHDLEASGPVTGVSVSAGIDVIEGYFIQFVQFETDPAGPATPTTVVVRQLTPPGSVDLGQQVATVYTVDDAGRPAGEVEGLRSQTDLTSGSATGIGYGPDGSPATLTDARGTYTFQYDAGGGGAPPAPPGVGRWLRERVDVVVASTAAYAAAAAAAVGYTIINAYVLVSVGGAVLRARVAESWSTGLDRVTWLIDQAGRQLLAVGDRVLAATKEAAQDFVRNLEEFGKAFADLWGQLQQFGASAGAVLQAVVNDPGAFVANLAAGAGGGVSDFLTHLPANLPNKLLGWLTGKLPDLPRPLPADWADVGQVSAWLLRVFRLGWADLEPLLVRKLGAAGNVALVAQAYDYLKTWIDEGDGGAFKAVNDLGGSLSPQTVFNDALGAGVGYVLGQLGQKAVTFVLEKFVVPGVGLLTSIYRTVSWVFGSLQQFQGLAGVVADIVDQIGNVVAGQTGRLRTLVEEFLNGLLPVGINFVASQLPLPDLASGTRDVIAKVRAAPQQAIDQALGTLKLKAGGALGLGGRPQRQGLLVKPVLYRVAGERHLLWAVTQSGGAVVMRARVSGPALPGRQPGRAGPQGGGPATPQRTLDDLLRGYLALDLTQVPEPSRAALGAAFGAARDADGALFQATLARASAAQLAPLQKQAQDKMAALAAALEAAAEAVRRGTAVTQQTNQILARTVDPPRLRGLDLLAGPPSAVIARYLPADTPDGHGPCWGIFYDWRSGAAYGLHSEITFQDYEWPPGSGLRFGAGRLRNVPYLNIPGRKTREAFDELEAHVEAQVAGFMRKRGLTLGVLYINKPWPCRPRAKEPDAIRCWTNLKYLLAPGSTLYVYGTQRDGTFTGQAE